MKPNPEIDENVSPSDPLEDRIRAQVFRRTHPAWRKEILESAAFNVSNLANPRLPKTPSPAWLSWIQQFQLAPIAVAFCWVFIWVGSSTDEWLIPNRPRIQFRLFSPAELAEAQAQRAEVWNWVESETVESLPLPVSSPDPSVAPTRPSGSFYRNPSTPNSILMTLQTPEDQVGRRNSFHIDAMSRRPIA